MGRACCHIEGGRDKDCPCAFERKQTGQLRKTDIIANHQPHPAPRGVEGGDIPAGGKGIGFHEILSAGDIDIKQMDFAVSCDAASLIIIDEGGVIDSAIRRKRNRACDHIQAESPCHFSDALQKRGVFGHGIAHKGTVFIGAAAHFGQNRQIRTLLLCLHKHLFYFFKIFLRCRQGF